MTYVADLSGAGPDLPPEMDFANLSNTECILTGNNVRFDRASSGSSEGGVTITTRTGVIGEVRARVFRNGAQTGGGLVLRSVASLQPRVDFGWNSSSTIRIRERQADGTTFVRATSSSVSVPVDADFWVRGEIDEDGVTARMKLWPASGTEPAGWQITGTLSEPVPTPARPGFSYFGGSSGSVVMRVVEFEHDDYDDPDPDPGPWTLTVDTDGEGDVSILPDLEEYDDEDIVELTATPDPGWSVADPLWTGDVPGGDVNDNPLELSMTQNRTVTANFEQDPEPPVPQLVIDSFTQTSPTTFEVTIEPHGTVLDLEPSLEARGRWCPPDDEE